jgi:hypothetical protein
MTQSKNLNDPNQPPSKAGPPVEKKNRPFKSTNYFYEVNDAKGKTIRIRINHVKYELDEFLNEAWDTEDRPKANAAYVNELYSPCPDDYQIRAVKTNARAETGVQPAIKGELLDGRRLKRIQKGQDEPFTSVHDAREKAQNEGKYLYLAKVQFPMVWYACRILDSFGDLVGKVVSKCLSFVLVPLWLPFAHPCEVLYELFFIDQHHIIKHEAKKHWRRNRLWLGRSRGYNYFTAFYNRCLYLGTYFGVHKFRGVDLFLRRHMTIRRGLELFLPASIAFLIIQRTTMVPATVHSRGLEKASKRLHAYPPNFNEQLVQLDMVYGPLRPGMELKRIKDGLFYTIQHGTIKDFVGGEYAYVPRHTIPTIVHPREFWRVSTETQQYPRLAMQHRIGSPEWSSEEDIQVCAHYEGAPPEDEDAGSDTFIPEHPYKRLKRSDGTQLKAYKKKNPYTSTDFTYRGKDIWKLYMQGEGREAFKNEFKTYQWVGKEPEVNTNKLTFQDTDRRPNRWQRTLAKVEAARARVLNRHPQAVEADTANRRFAFSPFGFSYDPPSTDPQPLRPFSRKETKLFQYALPTHGATESFALRQPVEGFMDTETLRQNLTTRFVRGMDILSEFIATDEDEEDWGDFNGDAEDFDDEDEAFNGDTNGFDDVDDEDMNGEEDEDENGEDDEEDDDLEDEEDENDLEDEDDDDLGDDEGEDDLEDEDDDDLDGEEEDDLEDVNGDDFDDENGNGDMDGGDMAPSKTITNSLEEEDASESEMTDVEEDEEDTADFTDNEDLEAFYTEDSEDDAPGVAYAPTMYATDSLFLAPNQYEPWQSVAWKGVVLQIAMYAGIELCVRQEDRNGGLRPRRVTPPSVYTKIEHIGRLPTGVTQGEYIGPAFKNFTVKKVLLAFQAKRGAELYAHSEGVKFWTFNVRTTLTQNQAGWCQMQGYKINGFLAGVNTAIGRVLTQQEPKPQGKIFPVRLDSRMSLLALQPCETVAPRFFWFDKVLAKAKDSMQLTNGVGTVETPERLYERQRLVNRLGGDQGVLRSLHYGYRVQNEIAHFPLVAMIKPGTERMSTLSKGLILLGDPGNGRSYFVRALATESRLPLLVTESNRYLDQRQGLVRLKTLFWRARASAPNIVFIRDLDFMTRHRERYPDFGSVRATTHLLMAMDGFTLGTEVIPSALDIFVIGSMETTAMMDDACIRSGRFEWVMRFFYPEEKERGSMLTLHSMNAAQINTTIGVDWNYVATLTNNFSCLDLKAMVNSSAVYAYKAQTFRHTEESVQFALGAVNQLYDLPETRFISTHQRPGFFEREEYQRRWEYPLKAPKGFGLKMQGLPQDFFTREGTEPIQKSVNIIGALCYNNPTFFEKQEYAYRASKARHANANETGPQTVRQETYSGYRAQGLTPSLISLFSEAYYLWNWKKKYEVYVQAKGYETYPMLLFDTYRGDICSAVNEDFAAQAEKYRLEAVTKKHNFISSFDLWRRTVPASGSGFNTVDVKSIGGRVRSLALWRSNRFDQGYILHGKHIPTLHELDGDILFGSMLIQDKMRTRLSFIAQNKGNDFASQDAAIFGTFETNSDLSFKCRKATTSARTDLITSELLSHMHKNWREE